MADIAHGPTYRTTGDLVEVRERVRAHHMRAYDQAFVGALFFRFPVLLPLLQEHLDDYESLLPHVLMGDVTRWVIGRFSANPANATMRDVLDFIESAFENAGNEDRELVAASFLENLPSVGPEAGVRELLGPALRGQESDRVQSS